ncbi:RagB/SusD family nutrient uptake outer membrane protein [Flavobacterium johnsoniae]|uniref:RagB/SusD family nutrient uptake outer membrane protein n=1 Tax=Flavobacterium johnsoniae TaxID=986 RepID=UPI0015BBDD69|nr:RagB/SusD family nutrient uptake outer membrane protein [Flavobacterium johnsoniae]NWL02872.1 RagB/SusD family nutrient uptake outer membrane protein [Flavobacterium collinsii]WJS94488.1 RagB/SusD family nutrient uptake outer membrane protein [Flavobacterium johnsoniae]
MKRYLSHTIFSLNVALFFVLSATGILTVSCDSFVETASPQSQLPSSAVFENYLTASAALTDIYSKIRDRGMLTGQSSGISYLLANYADELDFYGTPSSSASSFYINALLPGNTNLQEYWSVAYNQIYAANSVIERTKASLSLTEVQKKQLSGEAFFIRALVHFYLTNLYGDVPYIVSTDYKINSMPVKVSTKEVYNLVINDLNAAADMLGSEYIKNERTRPNRYAVLALQARVYLYDGKWAEAANASSAVLNASGLFALQTDLKSVFLKESKETIWQLQSSVSGKNTDEAASFIFFTVPPSSAALNSAIINSFTSVDKRKNSWTGSLSSGASTWYYPFKYKEFYNTSVSKEYPIMLRLSEQYLVRAEARAQQGDIIGSKEDLDQIRQRAGLSKTTAVTKQEILDAILEERKLELFSEYGHRFFDLKRTGNLDQKLSGIKPGWNTADRLFPIPQNEINLNSNLLPQNTGY